MVAEPGSSKAVLIEGLSLLRRGALILLIGFVLGIIGVFSSGYLTLSLMSLMSGGAGGGGAPATVLLGAAMVGVLFLLIGIILGILAFITWFRAAGRLSEYDPSRLGIGRTGMVLQLVGIVLALLALVAVIGFTGSLAAESPAVLMGVYAVLALALIGAVLVLVGIVLFGVMLMRLSEIEGVESGFKIAGILYMLTLIPYIGAILGLIATILIYVYAKRSIENLQAAG